MVELSVLDYENPTYMLMIMKDRQFESDSGVYVLTDTITDEIYYVGVTGNLKNRMNSHRSSWAPYSLHNSLFDKFLDNDLVKEKLDNTVVKFWSVDNFFLQDFYEQYFILTLNPTFNRERIISRNDRGPGVDKLHGGSSQI